MEHKAKILENESNEDNRNNNPNNNNTINNNKKEISLPLINENKRIYIHKPSDFIKNKYTFLGNLANNSELLSIEKKKTYHSPKFSMEDIKNKINIENQIIGSIMKDEVHSLPILLRNLIPSANKSLVNKKLKKNEIEFENNLLKYNHKNYENNNNYHSINSYNNRNNGFLNRLKNLNYDNSNKIDLKAYRINSEQIAQRADRLVNLNFMVSSGRKKRDYNAINLHNKNYYYNISGEQNIGHYNYYNKSKGGRNNYMSMN